MQRRIIATPAAPAAIGPYSQAVLVDGWLWCSGQIALDPATGVVVGTGSDAAAAKAQARKCLENLRGVLAAAGVPAGGELD